MTGGEQVTVRSVKRKLFDDDASSVTRPVQKRSRRPRTARRWRTPVPAALRADNRSLSDSDEWHSVADSQETFSEFDTVSNTSNSSSDNSFFLSPGPTLQKREQAAQINSNNFTWLLNFKVESLFQTPWDHPVDHDHNYRSVAALNCLMDEQALPSEGFSLSPLHHPLTMRGIRKPPYTYTELIELALRDKGELTVSGIYKWIMEHFPFFKATDDRWKNSVRHNLSINAHFKKGRKAQGSSHLWTIATDTEKKLKQELLNQANKTQWKRKLEELEQTFAVKATYLQRTSNGGNISNGITGNSERHNGGGQSVKLEAGCGTTPATTVYTIHRPGTYVQSLRAKHGLTLAGKNPLPQPMRKSAEDILNGHVEKKVEVQLLTPLRPMAYTFLLESREFLNPVTQREVVQESGLLDEVANAQVDHSLPQQIFNSICSEMEPCSNDLFEDELALNYLNISP